jgi:hypothetical protein
MFASKFLTRVATVMTILIMALSSAQSGLAIPSKPIQMFPNPVCPMQLSFQVQF